MSWWVELVDDKNHPVQVERHSEGGTYVLGGTTEASLNITYNYGKPFAEVGFNLKALHDKKANAVLAELERAVTELGIEQDADYWAATPGNAGFALLVLLRWAKANPGATFRID